MTTTERLRLSAGFGSSDRIAALRTGEVTAHGIELDLNIASPSEIFARMCGDLSYDVAEMSMGAYAYLVGSGDRSMVGLPAFTSRAFRHAMVYAASGSDIRCPADLNGKRIAIREWGMTAVVWIIGILAEEHGLDVRSIDWVAVRPPRVPIPMPEGASLRYLAPGETISSALESGTVDGALFHERVPKFESPNGPARRVFNDYINAERDYFRRTGIHPPMHCVVVRRELAERNPWIVDALYAALCESKDKAANDLLKTGALSAMLPFLAHAIDETRAIFGEDWWPYGVERNQVSLERFTRYAYEQALTPRQLAVSELFSRH